MHRGQIWYDESNGIFMHSRKYTYENSVMSRCQMNLRAVSCRNVITSALHIDCLLYSEVT